jgi:hypothetical protein
MLFVLTSILAFIPNPDPPARTQEEAISPPFLLAIETLSETPAQDQSIKSAFSARIVNALGIWPPLSDETVNNLAVNDAGAVLWLPASTEILQELQSQFPRIIPTVSYLHQQQAQMQTLTAKMCNKVWWDIMPEWDSSDWWIARSDFPIKQRALSYRTRQESFEAFKNYYFGLTALSTYWQNNSTQRGFNSTSVSGFTWSVHYAYEFGIDLAMLERNHDGLGDIQTGVSFIRGAAKQYKRPWGIDISEWRVAGLSTTSYNDNMQRIGGWSESYHKRHLYISYMSGANIVHLEAVPLYNSTGTLLNPLGLLVKDFADFSLRRHPDIGKPYAPTAIMLDFYHGWEPHHGRYQAGAFNSVWYWSVPYQDGDFMLDNLFAMIYPEYWQSGTTPGAPWHNPSEYNQMVSNGLDTRSYEPMGYSRWGDTFDVILSNASIDALRNYKTIILAGNIKLDSHLREVLQQWVSDGGTLVINQQQVELEDEAFLGVQIEDTLRSSINSKWLTENVSYTENLYNYTVVHPISASVVATNNNLDPIITKNHIGNGAVYLTTPHYLQDTNKSQILNVGQKLIDTLVNDNAIVRISEPKVEWLVNTSADKIIVTVVNNSGSDWNGSIFFKEPEGAYTISEWMGDTQVSSARANGRLIISDTIPAYDLKIYTLHTGVERNNISYLPIIKLGPGVHSQCR